jgi:hypothetical protein
VQSASESTHIKGQILDLVVSKNVENLVSETLVYPSMPPDHFAVFRSFCVAKPTTDTKNTISCRRFRDIDIEAFCSDIRESPLVQSPCEGLDGLIKQCDDCLRDILDKHAPVISRSVSRRWRPHG